MLVTTKAIVISSLRYQDKGLIVKCFTQSDGLKSYYVRDAFSGKKNLQKIIYFQPLTLLEIEASHKNKGTLEYFKEIKLSHAYSTITSDIVKTTIALFLSEMLHHSIREEEKNENLYSFLETALLWLDHNDNVANFHLILLFEMTKFLGFYPDGNSDHRFFEMTEGIFIPQQSLSCLSENESLLIRKLMALKFDNNTNAFHFSERQALLKIIMDYYAFHLEGFKKPNSLSVFREIFS